MLCISIRLGGCEDNTGEVVINYIVTAVVLYLVLSPSYVFLTGM